MTPPPRTISHLRTTPGGSRRSTSTMFGIGPAVLGVVTFMATAVGPRGDAGPGSEPPPPTTTDAVKPPAPEAIADGY